MAERIMVTDEEYIDRLGGWDAALRHQEEQQRVLMEQERNAAMAQQISANRGVYDGYAQMGNAIATRQAQFMDNANAHLASSLRLAAENGGRLPQYAWQGLGGALGLDGKDAAIVGGGFDKKGGFMLAVARKNPQTGQVEQTPMSFTPQQQYSLMLSAPGIFSRQEVEGMRGQLIDNFHMHPDQVPQVPQGWGETGNVGVGNRTTTGDTSGNPSWRWLTGQRRRSSISAFGANGRGGFTQYGSNEDTGYQLQQRDSGTRAPEPELSEKERIALAREQGQMERSRMNNESREKLQQQKNEAAIQVAETSAGATKSKADAMKYVADVRAKIKEAQSGKGGWTPTAGDLAKLGKLMNYESGLSDDQRNEVAGLMSGMAEVMAKGLKNKDEAPPPPGKTEEKPGDNGNGGRTITRGQLDRAVKAGATYDEKAGILKTKDGRTMKIAAVRD